jgi:hypothetical protein
MSFVPAPFPKAEDLAARDAFVRSVAANGVCFVVEGVDGSVRVPSARHPGRHIALLWSDRAEATRWASVLTAQSLIRAISLAQLLAEHLPTLTNAGHYVGPDWSDAPAEPELAGGELSKLLRHALATEFAHTAHTTRQVWLLKDATGLVTLPSISTAGAEVLPVFASHEQAAAHATTQVLEPARQPLAEFLGKTLMSCIAAHWRLAPAYLTGPDVLELAPWDMKALLHGTSRPVRGAR